MSNDALDAPGFIANVIDTSTICPHPGVVGTDTFEGLDQDEERLALEWNPTDDAGHNVFNFALARVRLVSKTTGSTPSPVRVFFRLFQAQNTGSTFDDSTTYRFATDGTLHGRKISLLGVDNPTTPHEYLTIPCFATARNNLAVAADMRMQDDLPNARVVNTVGGAEVDTFFGCWIDNGQPDQLFLPAAPPAGNLDGPWTAERAAHTLQSITTALTVSPHQCLIAEVRYDDAPVIRGQDSRNSTSWPSGTSPGSTHPTPASSPRGGSATRSR